MHIRSTYFLILLSIFIPMYISCKSKPETIDEPTLPTEPIAIVPQVDEEPSPYFFLGAWEDKENKEFYVFFPSGYWEWKSTEIRSVGGCWKFRDDTNVLILNAILPDSSVVNYKTIVSGDKGKLFLIFPSRRIDKRNTVEVRIYEPWEEMVNLEDFRSAFAKFDRSQCDVDALL